jgi:hypothetical protein
MAASFSDLGTIASNPNFQSRVAYAMATAAVNVYTEGTGVDGHTLRVAFSKSVFTGNYNIFNACLMVLTNATIAAEANVATTPGFAIPDGDIQFAVNSLWNDFAGA